MNGTTPHNSGRYIEYYLAGFIFEASVAYRFRHRADRIGGAIIICWVMTTVALNG